MNMREQYINGIKEKLDKWNTELKRLEEKITDVKDEAKAKLTEEVRIAETKRNDLQGKLKDLQNARDDAWEDLKIGVDMARNALGESIKSAMERFG